MKPIRLWQIVLGGILCAAAVSKAYDPVPVAKMLKWLGLGPKTLFPAVGVLIGTEILFGLFLILPRPAQWVRVGSIALLGVFTLFLLAVLVLPTSPACGCMGLASFGLSAKHDQMFGLSRNVLLLAAGGFCWQWERQRQRKLTCAGPTV